MAARCLAALAFLSALTFAAPAGALTVRPTKTVEYAFTGAACGSTDGALVELPRGARSAHIVAPEVGDVLASDDDDVTPVAQITAASVGELGPTLVAGFEATGTDDVCANPQNYTEDGWATVDVELAVSYVQDVATYVRGFSGRARRRPGRLDIGIGFLTSLSWRSWDGRVARGAGTGPGGAPVSVRLSRPRNCGRWRYLTVRYRYTGAVPEGAKRSRRIRLGCR